MRGIPEDKAIEIGEQIDSCKYLECSVKEWLRDECQELNPWMTLDEFLKSGFEGLCWVYSVYKDIFVVQFIDDNFISINTGAKAQLKYIERIMPIHKPEPPR